MIPAKNTIPQQIQQVAYDCSFYSEATIQAMLEAKVITIGTFRKAKQLKRRRDYLEDVGREESCD